MFKVVRPMVLVYHFKLSTPFYTALTDTAHFFLHFWLQEHNIPQIWYKCILSKRQDIPDLHVASYLMSKFFSANRLPSRAESQVWADIFEEKASSPRISCLRRTLSCVSTCNLYVPATLEVLCEFALQHSLSVELAISLINACAKVNFKPQCLEKLGNSYAIQLAKMADTDDFPVDQVLQLARDLLYLDSPTPCLVRKIFSVGFLQEVDAIATGELNLSPCYAGKSGSL